MTRTGRDRYRQALRRQRQQRPPVPRRITIALDLAGLYGPEVDQALGGAEPMVDMWEAGTLVPTPDQVERLATLTGQPIAFFYVDTPPLGPVHVCRRGRGGRCEVVDDRPDAQVIALPTGQLTLF